MIRYCNGCKVTTFDFFSRPRFCAECGTKLFDVTDTGTVAKPFSIPDAGADRVIGFRLGSLETSHVFPARSGMGGLFIGPRPELDELRKKMNLIPEVLFDATESARHLLHYQEGCAVMWLAHFR